MDAINIEDLEQFIAKQISVSIQDTIEEEKAPFLEKTLIKVELCPDETHIRLFFDNKRFLAIPRNAVVIHTNKEWVAYDSASQLNYVIRKVND